MSDVSVWKCEVCGYVHRGAAPPESCPVCGADRDRFSPLTLLTPPPPPPPTGLWRCTICDHLHHGAVAPGLCPVCGAVANLFLPQVESTPAGGTTEVRRLLILGAGIAGVTAAEEARTIAPEVAITLLTREAAAPYYRLNLTRFLAGEVGEEALPLQEPAWYAAQRINVIHGEAVAIERDEGRVRLQDGQSLPYDRLILAGGAHPFVPPIAGSSRQGVMTLRTFEDARSLLARVRPGGRCLCVGGGLLGLETAAALRRRGMAVTVVEGFGWLLPRQLPPAAGHMLQRAVEKQGIDVICGVQVQEFLGDELVRGVRLSDGRELPCDFVVLAAGVRPNTYLARQAGLKVAGGVVVDDRMTTSDPAIYAAGDIAEHRSILYGIWPAAFAQGMVAGASAVGAVTEFPGMPPATRLKVLGVELFSIGRIAAEDASYHLVEVEEAESYRALLCRDNHAVGGALLGDTALAPLLKEAVESGAQLHERPELCRFFPDLAGV